MITRCHEIVALSSLNCGNRWIFDEPSLILTYSNTINFRNILQADCACVLIFEGVIGTILHRHCNRLNERSFPRQKNSLEQKNRNTSASRINKVLGLIGARGGLRASEKHLARTSRHEICLIQFWSFLEVSVPVDVTIPSWINQLELGDAFASPLQSSPTKERTQRMTEEVDEMWMSHPFDHVFIHDITISNKTFVTPLITRKKSFRELLHILDALCIVSMHGGGLFVHYSNDVISSTLRQLSCSYIADKHWKRCIYSSVILHVERGWGTTWRTDFQTRTWRRNTLTHRKGWVTN